MGTLVNYKISKLITLQFNAYLMKFFSFGHENEHMIDANDSNSNDIIIITFTKLRVFVLKIKLSFYTNYFKCINNYIS